MFHNSKVILLILDGWGHGLIPEVSAIAQADTPFIDSLYQTCPNAELTTHGPAVGLPTGQMGNSEVGTPQYRSRTHCVSGTATHTSSH
jgi:2,3-bisphosphoglycerate-independent phosphoglycerate mutase